MKTDIIERKGRRFAVLPLKDFEQLKHDAEMLEDIRAYDAAMARNEEVFPSDVAERLASGENPIRVFRDYRGLTQEQLAKAAKIARPYLAEIESGRKRGSVSVLKAIASALKLELGDVAGLHERPPRNEERVLVAYRKDDGTSVVTTAFYEDETGWRWGKIGTLRRQERITHWSGVS